jgi:integrase
MAVKAVADRNIPIALVCRTFSISKSCYRYERKPVINIRDLGALPDFTLHVLRHSFATVAHEIGYSELTIAGLLGHAQGTVTSRYAHHVDHALSSAADRVSATIAERMGLV